VEEGAEMTTFVKTAFAVTALLALAGCSNGYFRNHCTWGSWNWYHECDLCERPGCHHDDPCCTPCSPYGETCCPGEVVSSRWVEEHECAPAAPPAAAPKGDPLPVPTVVVPIE
jgi:hypothetical protein